MGNRSYAHRQAQKQGKERDYYTCQACGSTDHTEGHHIIDHQYNGAAHPDNIITLCHSCHQEAHKGGINISVI